MQRHHIPTAGGYLFMQMHAAFQSHYAAICCCFEDGGKFEESCMDCSVGWYDWSEESCGLGDSSSLEGRLTTDEHNFDWFSWLSCRKDCSWLLCNEKFDWFGTLYLAFDLTTATGTLIKLLREIFDFFFVFWMEECWASMWASGGGGWPVVSRSTTSSEIRRLPWIIWPFAIKSRQVIRYCKWAIIVMGYLTK